MHPRRTALPVLAAVLALGLSACGRENDEKAADPATTESTTPTPTATATPTREAYPTFEPADYTYRLEVICFCPMTGPLEVRVVDGKVADAVQVAEPRTKAAAFARLTINDIIAKANDPKNAKAEVTWPAGQDHPTRVRIDQIEKATDDEVTYVIKDVEVSAG